jgi:histidinol-phosphate aminotransferase
MPDHVRISIGTKDEMLHFYEAMNKVLPDYRVKYGALR